MKEQHSVLILNIAAKHFNGLQKALLLEYKIVQILWAIMVLIV